MTTLCLSLALLAAPWPLSFVGVVIAAEQAEERRLDEIDYDPLDAAESGETNIGSRRPWGANIDAKTGWVEPGRNFRVNGWRVRQEAKISEMIRWAQERERERLAKLRERPIG